MKALKFHPISLKKYPIFSLKEKALDNPDLGAVINAANEVAVFKFLKNECEFLEISRLVLAAAKKFKDVKISSQSELFAADGEARAWAEKEIKKK